MLKKIRFFKINEGPEAGWYCNPKNKSWVDPNEADNNEPGSFVAKLLMKNHNQFGATYILTGPIAEKHNAIGYELWICNVTHDVLGEHPKSIYIHQII